MASEIPEDLKAKARKVAAEIEGRVEDQTIVARLGRLMSLSEFAEHLIAQALLAERERCRLVAAGFDDGGDSGFSLAARTIERIIRQDNPNETEQGNG